MLRTVIFTLAAITAVCGSTSAQEFQKPGDEHRKMKELEGTWDAVMEMGDQKSKAVATYKSICNGMWLESDFDGTIGEMKFRGRGLDGYDIARKKYVGTWVDSLSSAPMHFEGTSEDNGKRVIAMGESVGPDGKPQKFKMVTDYKDKDHFTFKMFMVIPNMEDQLAFSIDYTRRK